MHAKTGVYPKSISDIPGIWTDPFGGKPLHVKIAGDSFRVYSVGPDGVDNGGADRSESKSYPTFNGDEEYDIVAAYPKIGEKHGK
ncbi:MAG TPA: hypothetical protein VGL56_12150 [Fimbriimonadaceae bacterium]